MQEPSRPAGKSRFPARAVLFCAAAGLAPAIGFTSVASGASNDELRHRIGSSKSNLGSSESKIDDVRGELAQAGRRKDVLSSEIASYTQKIATVGRRLTDLRHRIRKAEQSIAREEAELAEVRKSLEAERRRLERLKRKLQRAIDRLSVRLRAIFREEQPDMATVILDSKGFTDLLNRVEFMRRITTQDQDLIRLVRRLKNESKRRADELARLERRQRQLVQRLKAERAALARDRAELQSRSAELSGARSGKRSTLMRVNDKRHALSQEIGSLEAEQAAVAAQVRAAQAQLADQIRAQEAARAQQNRSSSGTSGSSGTPSSPSTAPSSPAPTAGPAPPAPSGSGYIWPVSGPVTGVFGEQRPGHIHAGIDISASMGTPIRAAASGTVAVAGWQGGYGMMTCIAHSGSTSTCYAHQSAIHTSVGASVSQGQTIGLIGSTGNSTGPHLHFEVRVQGSAVNPLGYL